MSLDRYLRHALWVTVVTVACFSVSLRAQTTAGIVGTVTDATGATVPGAQVQVVNLGTKLERQASTSASGDYFITLLPIGAYSVTVTAHGFKTFTLPSLSVSGGDMARVDAHLQLGTASQTVEVTAQPAALHTDTATVQTTLATQTVESLPVDNRNFMALAQLAPGANAGVPTAMSSGQRPDDRRSNSNISVGAQYERMNNYTIDGMDNNDRTIGTIIVKPSMDDIAELQVETNQYSAATGRTAGAVVNVITKSGGNQYHGSLYGFLRNSALDARPFFASSKPGFRQLQYGGSLGGPIRTNKLFFFADYEGFHNLQGQTFVNTVPTPNEINGNFQGTGITIYDPSTTTCADPSKPATCVRQPFLNDAIAPGHINPIAKNFLALYPAPNVLTAPGVYALRNNYVTSQNGTQRYNDFDARVDAHLNANNSMYVRYSYNNTNTWTPSSLPEVNGVWPVGSGSFSGLSHQFAHAIALDYIHIFSATAVLDLKAGAARYDNNDYDANYGNNVSTKFGLPGANYNAQSSGLSLVQPNGYTSLGDSQFIPLQELDNVFQYMGSLTLIRGSHTIQMGAGLIRRQTTVAQSRTPRGTFAFNPLQTGNPATKTGGDGIASFLLGIPSSINFQTFTIYPGYRYWEPSAYIQDDWRATSSLTLNLGVRYDVFTPLTEAHNRLSNFFLGDNQLHLAGVDGVSATGGVHTDYRNIAPRLGFAWQVLSGTVLRGGYGLTFIPENSAAPSNFNMQNAPFSSAYSFSNSTLFPTANFSQGLPPNTPQPINAPTGSVAGVDLHFKSTYVEQMSLSLEHAFGANVASLGYVGAMSYREVGGEGGGCTNLNQPDPSTAPNITTVRPYYGILPKVATVNYCTPNGRDNYNSMQATFTRRLSDGLYLGANYTWAHAITAMPNSGQVASNLALDKGNAGLNIPNRFAMTASYALPFGANTNGLAHALVAGWNLNLAASWQTGLPYTVRDGLGLANTGAGDRPNLVGAPQLSHPTLQQWFNTAAFAAQPFGTAGTAGVNILQGPDQRQLDLSLVKDFAVRDSSHIEFRAEGYNITNTPNFSTPNATFGTGSFGTVTSTGTAIPRQIQLAIKWMF